MKLNLGCGNDYKGGYVNVDWYRGVKTDLCKDILTLSYEENSIDEIIAYDVIEHFSFERSKELLRRIFKWLKRGGVLKVKTPEFNKTFEWGKNWRKLVLAKREGWAAVNAHIYGLEYQPHLCMWGKEYLFEFLKELGFRDFKVLGGNSYEINFEVIK